MATAGTDNAPNGTQADVALLVDWENLKFSLRERNRRPNVTALRQAAERFGRIVYARAYADWQDPVHSGDPASLYLAGLEPVYVLTKRYTDDSGEIRLKNSVDVKLAADCIEASHQFPNISTYIMVTGDHGFIHVLNTLRPRGKRVVVIGVSWTTAAQLTEQADVVLYYDIDVERIRDDGALEVAPAPAPATKKVSPVFAQTAETAANQLRLDGNQGVDQRRIAEVLEQVLSVVREYRKDRRDISVSVLGQELQKRMSMTDFAQHVRGKARGLAQALASHGQIKLIQRDFIDWIYLPEEPDDLIRAQTPPSMDLPRYDYGGFVYTDLSSDKRDAVIHAIYEERNKPGTAWLTFNRLLMVVQPIVARDDQATKNLLNNMVTIGIIRLDSERQGRDPESGAAYAYRTFAIDLGHPDVKKVLHLA
ncbi:MAG: NYN domain-containing protein [Dehalococcoidia bacterium]